MQEPVWNGEEKLLNSLSFSIALHPACRAGMQSEELVESCGFDKYSSCFFLVQLNRLSA